MRGRILQSRPSAGSDRIFIDLCGMTVAVMAVQIVRLRHSKNASLRDRIVPVGRMLHETMSKLSDREKNIAAASKRTDNDAISVLGKVRAYMRVLSPNRGTVKSVGMGAGLRWRCQLCWPLVWHEGAGWFRRNDNGLLASIGMCCCCARFYHGWRLCC